MIIEKHIVKNEQVAVRLIKYCQGLFPQLPSNASVKKAIKRGGIQLNGEIVESGRWLKKGDVIQLVDMMRQAKVYELPLPVIYEDEFLAIINKPAGVVISGNQFKTIANAISHNILVSKEIDALSVPRPVHRLDAATSGLLMIAKTKKAEALLGKMLEQKNIQKTYRAIVQGNINKSGCVSLPINGQKAHTHYKSIVQIPSLQNEYVSLLELQPFTGRTHQLRIHLASMGNPIVGDKLYGTQGNIQKNKGLFLAAVALEFQHPITNKELNVNIKMPHKFEALLEREQRRWDKFH